MRESLGVYKPKGVMKVKARFSVAEVGSERRNGALAHYRPVSTRSVEWGGDRAYTLGPERW